MKETARWHYTTGDRFVQIVQDGFIKPATAGIEDAERPVVWFSTNQHWEFTANKMLRSPVGALVHLDMAGTAREAGGLVRFGVAPETAPHNWNALKELSGMSKRMADGLYRAAIAQGARPSEWWGTFEVVARPQWVAIHVYRDGLWIDVPFGS